MDEQLIVVRKVDNCPGLAVGMFVYPRVSESGVVASRVDKEPGIVAGEDLGNTEMA